MRRAIEADRRSGASIFYIDTDNVLRQLFDYCGRLAASQSPPMALLADDFVEVPFFDGHFEFPTGWADWRQLLRPTSFSFMTRELTAPPQIFASSHKSIARKGPPNQSSGRLPKRFTR